MHALMKLVVLLPLLIVSCGKPAKPSADKNHPDVAAAKADITPTMVHRWKVAPVEAWQMHLSSTLKDQGQTRLPARVVQQSTSDSSPEGLRSVVEGFLHSDRADELLKRVVSRDGEKEGVRVSELLTTGAPIASYLFPRRNLTERMPISPDDLRLQTWYFPLLYNGKEVAMVSAGAGDTIESVTCTGPLWPPSAFRLPKAKDTMGASPGRIVISTVPFRLKCFGVMDDSQKIDAASFVCTALDWGQAGGGVMSDTLRFHEICQLAQTFFDKNLRAMYESGNFGDGWK